jgi:hypothetical protein
MEEMDDDDDDDDVRLGNRLTRLVGNRTLFDTIIAEIRRQPQQQHSGRRRSSKARKARKSRKSRNTRRRR